jgi:hypothetical protein
VRYRTLVALSVLLVGLTCRFSIPRSELMVGFNPREGYWVTFVLLAGVMSAIGTNLPLRRAESLVALAISLATVCVTDGLCRMIGAFAAVGLVLCQFELVPLRRAAFGFVFAACFVGTGLLVQQLCQVFEARLPSPIPPDLSFAAFRLLGFDVSTSASSGLIMVEGRGAELSFSLDKAYFQESVVLCLSFLAIRSLQAPLTSRTTLSACLLVFAFSITAFVINAAAYAVATDYGWWRDSHALVYLIVGSCGLAFLSKEVGLSVGRTYTHYYISALTVGFSMCGAVLIRGDLLGNKADTRILWHEAHSDWEWTDTEFSTAKYGNKTVYNYTCLFQLLKKRYSIRRLRDPLSKDLLSGYSVVVVKTPTESYSSSEIDALENYVQNGGSLILVGDHTDAFGMSTHLNPIASRFGASFNIDSFADPDDIRTLYSAGKLSHPFAKTLSDPFLFYTGCSLSLPWLSIDMVRSEFQLLDNFDRSKGTFFGDFKVQGIERVGSVVQAAGISCGKGKVFLWSDSTLFSNFALFYPGKLEGFFGMLEWARIQAPYAYLLRCAGVCCFGIALFLLAWRGNWLIALVSFLGGMFMLSITSQLLEERLRLPEVVPSESYVYFLDKPDTLNLPLLMPLEEANSPGFSSIFVSTARLGLTPRVRHGLSQRSPGDTMVLLPNSVEPEAAPALKGFIESGGHLIVPETSDATAQRLLSEIGLEIDRTIASARSTVLFSREILGTTRDVSVDNVTISGGGPREAAAIVKSASSGAPLIFRKKIGRGCITVCTMPAFFNDVFAGKPDATPKERALLVLSTWYAVLEVDGNHRLAGIH